MECTVFNRYVKVLCVLRKVFLLHVEN